jgi:hypothetical protein
MKGAKSLSPAVLEMNSRARSVAPNSTLQTPMRTIQKFCLCAFWVVLPILFASCGTNSSSKPSLSVLTISLPSGTQGSFYLTTLAATGGVLPYTWSISAGSLPAWATLNASTGVISGTPDASGTTIFTVQVTDSEAPPATASRSLSIVVRLVANLNSELSGQYAFSVQGFDSSTADQFALIGSFIADGSGHITSGEYDSNGPLGYKAAVTFSGTYRVGTDNRGTMTISDSIGGSHTYVFAVGSISNGVASKGTIMEFDDTTGTSDQRGSGEFGLQDPASFSLSSINGPYAFQVGGQKGTTGTRLVTTGAFTANGSGSLFSGQFDTNSEGTLSTGSFTATLTRTSDTSTFGRLTLRFISGISDTAAVYLVSGTQFLMLGSGIEAVGGLTAGQCIARTSSAFTNASLNGIEVVYSQGLGSVPGNSSASIGLVTFDGFSALTARFDNNNSGSLSSQSGSGTYSIAANGRTQFNGLANPFILYLTDTNQGFVMGAGGDVGSGLLTAQSARPFSNSSVLGAYFFGSVPPSVAHSGLSSGIATSAGDGTINVTGDASDPQGVDFGTKLTDMLTIGSNGRATDSNGDIFYIISPLKILLMNSTDAYPVVTSIRQ